MAMGKFLSTLAMETQRFTTYLPAYGAEVRGGTSHCLVIISDGEIYSPFIEEADTVISMNEPSLVKFEKRVKKNGLLLLNTSLINIKPERDDLSVASFPFTQTAVELGNIKCANTVALGVYLARKKIAQEKEIYAVLDKVLYGLKEDLIRLNKKAMERGLKDGK